jgi:hypothetical protein
MIKKILKILVILFFAIPGFFASIELIQWGFSYPDTLVNVGTYIFCFLVFTLVLLTIDFSIKIFKKDDRQN